MAFMHTRIGWNREMKAWIRHRINTVIVSEISALIRKHRQTDIHTWLVRFGKRSWSICVVYRVWKASLYLIHTFRRILLPLYSTSNGYISIFKAETWVIPLNPHRFSFDKKSASFWQTPKFKKCIGSRKT